MKISFLRSGGFAGRATNVAGSIEFEREGAQVDGEGTPYRREVPADEAAAVGQLALAEIALKGKGGTPDSTRDAWQYTATVETDDGKQHALTLRPGKQGGGGEKEVVSLFDWVQRETQRIWDYRLAKIAR